MRQTRAPSFLLYRFFALEGASAGGLDHAFLDQQYAHCHQRERAEIALFPQGDVIGMFEEMPIIVILPIRIDTNWQTV